MLAGGAPLSNNFFLKRKFAPLILWALDLAGGGIHEAGNAFRGTRIVRDGQHPGVVLAHGDVQVTHAAVEIRTLALLEPERGVMFRMDLDGPAQHVHKLLAAMLTPVVELVYRPRPHQNFQRDHGLARQFRGVSPVVVLATGEMVALATPSRRLASRDDTL